MTDSTLSNLNIDRLESVKPQHRPTRVGQICFYPPPPPPRPITYPWSHPCLLDKAQNNVIASQSTNPPAEENNVNNVNANEMDMEFHNKCVREEKSPEASRKKREMEREIERESEEEDIHSNVTISHVNQSERPANASKVNNNHLFVPPAPVRQSKIKSNASCNNSRLSSTESVHGQDAECTFAEGQEAEAKKPNGHNAEWT